MFKGKQKIILFFLLAVSGFVSAGSVVKFDDDGTLVVNGKRTIVYGTFRDISEDWRNFGGVKEAGFNLTHDYYFEQKAYDKGIENWIKEVCEYLDSAENAGVGVFLGFPRQLIWKSELEEIKELVNSVKDKPALWMWYLMDEPLIQYKPEIKKGTVKDVNDAIEKFRLAYETVKQVDPNHPIILVDPYKRMKEHPEFGKYCDTIWPDVYSHRYSILSIKRDIEGLQSLHPDKPNIGVPHGGSLLPYVRRKEQQKGLITFPQKLIVTDKSIGNSPDVLWGNLHSCLAGGSQGIVFYWAPKYRHDLKKNTPENWRAICNIGKFLRKMEPVLVNGNKNAGIEMNVNKWGHLNRQQELTGQVPEKEVLGNYDTVAMWQREFNGDIYVGLVCDFVPVQKVTLKLPFEFNRVYLLPYNLKVIDKKADEKHFVDYDNLPVVLWNMAGNEITFIMQDAKSLVLKFEK